MNGDAPLTALLVDEAQPIRLLLRNTLEARPLRLIEASTVSEAWALILVERPALVITEMWLPGEDPLEFCRVLKRKAETAGTRVVVLTTMAGEQNHGRAVAAGADEVVTKPFRPAQLLAIVDRLLDWPAGKRWQASS